jgi:hypothetical protein
MWYEKTTAAELFTTTHTRRYSFVHSVNYTYCLPTAGQEGHGLGRNPQCSPVHLSVLLLATKTNNNNVMLNKKTISNQDQ